jgi:uncharacterized protein
VEPLLGIVDLVGALRRGGVPASAERVQAMLRAVDEVGDLYWAGRLTLCGSPEDLMRYDMAFAAYFAGRNHVRPPTATPWARPVLRQALFATGRREGDNGASPQPEILAVQASPVEVLRHRDLSQLSMVEREEINRLIALLATATPRRPSRRYRPDSRGVLDPRRSARAILRVGGEPAKLAWRSRRRRPRRLVLLVDVSGSMAPYADGLLRFAHAAVRNRPHSTEVFALGTRLTRLTAAMATKDPDVALRAAGEVIPDWRGGTRLGESLNAFLRGYGHRGMARRAAVVVFSDGWEHGDPAPLQAAAAHLARLAHRVVWATPHAARPGFAPLAGGLVAVLPHVDALLSGHSVAALEELIREVCRA